VRIEWLLADIEKRAAQCLVEKPHADHAQDLARAALELVRVVRGGEHPYRDGGGAGSDEQGKAGALVALERALDECRDDLARAERALEECRDELARRRAE
jgi:hypothetical protein